MDECDQEDKPYSSRHRSPTFSREEVNELVRLIDKYKHIVMNKSICASACHAKDVAWAKMAKTFNERGFEYVRSVESLKRKWENMKKDTRKISKNIIDMKLNEFNKIDAKIVSLMCEADNNGAMDSPIGINGNTDIDENDEGVQQKEATHEPNYPDYPMKFSECESGDKQSDEESEDDETSQRRSKIGRSLNFSPKECSLLLQCVKQEKNQVFSKDVTGRAIKLKNRAWSKITESYNKLNAQKRSTKVLRTKFNNMKRRAKKVCFKDSDNKHEKLIEDSPKNIKREPEFGYKMNEDSDWHNDDADDDYSADKIDSSFLEFTPDPLSSVLNGDSGIGSITHLGSANPSENKEIVKLKMELLNFQMETAKLERKRIEDAMHAERVTRESQAVETALRLRAARLDAVAAEMKIPPSHPALHYTAEEARAQQYLLQYHQT